MPVIDIHTHMMSDAWMELLKKNGAPDYGVGPIKGGNAIFEHGAPFLVLTPGMFDNKVRIKAMDEAGVDIGVLSLTAPSVYWGTAEQSAEAARVINDDMRAAQTAYPDRIRWMFLTDPKLAPIWKEIDDRKLPVLVHPTLPPGFDAMDIGKYSLAAAVAFTFDTTLAVSRMVLDGFFERFPSLKLIAAHGGGTIPYINERVNMFHKLTTGAREKISESPNKYFQHIYYDAVVYQDNALRACIELAGPDHVLYGSDYPHQTGDMPGCLARVDRLPKDQKEKIRGGNAQRLFGI
jgi:aminocarboxymuconate-semialdehyde decarboxylase